MDASNCPIAILAQSMKHTRSTYRVYGRYGFWFVTIMQDLVWPARTQRGRWRFSIPSLSLTSVGDRYPAIPRSSSWTLSHTTQHEHTHHKYPIYTHTTTRTSTRCFTVRSIRGVSNTGYQCRARASCRTTPARCRCGLRPRLATYSARTTAASMRLLARRPSAPLAGTSPPCADHAD